MANLLNVAIDIDTDTLQDLLIVCSYDVSVLIRFHHTYHALKNSSHLAVNTDNDTT